VERNFSLGQRDVYVPAILEGEVDLFPEYTGNLLQYFDPSATQTEAQAVYAALAAALPEGLTALALSPASDQDSYNVTQEFASANNLISIADLANLGSVTLGGAPELAERPYGPSGLLSVYGVTVDFVATGDTTVESLVAGEVDMANVYSADPRINQLGLVTLSDPEGLFLASNLVPIASAALDQGAIDAINAVSLAMSADELVAMNVRSVEEELSAAEIAGDWLRSEGLID
jgi:osmoprotectant transport system substrate-binding protein